MKVSIVIPTFNRSAYLKQCIDAALAQTYPCEIIVSDHGSTDNTPEVVREYEQRITYLRRPVDKGVHFCWLDGVINASGELIHINYDDDWIEPAFIEKALGLMDKETGFVFTKVNVYDEVKGGVSKTLFSDFGETGKYSIKKAVNYDLFSVISPGCTLIRKKDILDNLFCGKVPFSNIEYKGVGPDLLFTLMLGIQYKKVGFINEPLAVFRAHEASITIDAEKNTKKTIEILEAYDQSRLYYLLNAFVRKFKIYAYLRLYLKIKRKLIQLKSK